MRIDVAAAGGEFDDQTRAYAEYRVFSSLARFSGLIGHACVSLRRPPGTRSVVCSIAMTLGSGDRTRVATRGRHASDAIDRAAARAAEAVRRRQRTACAGAANGQAAPLSE